MNQLVTWFCRNPVAANLLMLFIVVGGLTKVMTMKHEIFPEFAPDMITVTVVYAGAAPIETEESLCMRIEEAVQSLSGVKRVTAIAGEGSGTVTIELLTSADKSRALDEVKSRVDAIDTFPVDAEKPVVTEVTLVRQVLNVAVSGDVDETTLKRLAEQVRDDLLLLPQITQVRLRSVRPYEIAIEISEAQLRRHSLTFDDVTAAIRRSSIDLPGGSIKTDSGEILLRTKSQAYTGEDFEHIVLLARPDGTRIEIGDIAVVTDGFEDIDQSARFDGRPTSMVAVYRVGNQNALTVAEATIDYVQTAQHYLPEGVSLTTWANESEMLQSRQDLLLKNGLQGFLLVFAVLALFLRFKLAVWVSLGIPISFLGTLWVMPAMDQSINMISLFAFIIVLGIVVDDAIVVGENIYTHSKRDKPSEQAAIDGTHEVAIPVTFAILTTVAAFAPMLFVPGNMGKLWAVIPAVVIPTLLFSMVESKLILPAHLRHLKTRGEKLNLWSRFQTMFADGLETFSVRVYRPVLRIALNWRYATVATATAALILTIGLVAGGWVRFVFFPPVEGDNVAAILTMPQGTPPEVTGRAVERLESAAQDLGRILESRENLPSEDYGEAFRTEFAKVRANQNASEHPYSRVVLHTLASVGDQPYRKVQEEGGGHIVAAYLGAHYGEVNIQLAPSESRNVTSTEVANLWREMVGPIAGATELKLLSSLINIGDDIDIQVSGPDLDTLRAAADALKQQLAIYPAISGIADSFLDGKQEILLSLKRAAEPLGLTTSDLGRQVRQGFYGEEAQRVQRNRDDIKVMVRYPRAERRSLSNLEQMRIRTAAGDEVPFSTVADASFGVGYSAIQRTDRMRSLHVTAEVDEDKSDVNILLADLQKEFLPNLLSDYPGIRYSFEGERKQQAETLGGLARGFMIALLLIYGLMAIPFKSYVQPLIVMTAIPFGLVGAVIGHMIMGMEMSVLSMCGVVALAGVVVNDSLVLVDFVNRSRVMGTNLVDAVREAGVARFRPILLTSLTTFAGLTPILLEQSVQAKILIPMAVSLAFGVLFATFITLLLVPACYLILEDFKRLWVKDQPQAV